MAIEWLPDSELIHFGDAAGNPMTSKIGLVEVDKKVTKVGLKTWPGTEAGPAADPPDRTFDLLTVSDAIRVLTKMRKQLINRTGGMS